jgi:hypothetical protein
VDVGSIAKLAPPGKKTSVCEKTDMLMHVRNRICGRELWHGEGNMAAAAVLCQPEQHHALVFVGSCLFYWVEDIVFE